MFPGNRVESSIKAFLKKDQWDRRTKHFTIALRTEGGITWFLNTFMNFWMQLCLICSDGKEHYMCSFYIYRVQKNILRTKVASHKKFTGLLFYNTYYKLLLAA